ncbi:glucose 1-dehydrogenase [Myxococcota bacterium]|nr:glucose 1-dehydrogenase [Myxococcota bacterium]
MDRLKGRVAIITGSGQGIGRGIAHRFAKEGARIVVSDWKVHRGERVCAELHEMGAEAISIPADISSREDIEGLVEGAVEAFDGVDILVNNAQTFTPNVPFEEKTDEMWTVSLLTGPLATFWSMRAVHPVMKARGGGRIINFASLNGELGQRLTVDYNASKEAIRTITKTAAREWGHDGILVNAIAPGAASPVYQAWAKRQPEMAAEQERKKPIQRAGDPELDIGGVALFLASDDSRYLTGHTLFVDGGAWLGPSRERVQDDPEQWRRPEHFARIDWNRRDD